MRQRKNLRVHEWLGSVAAILCCAMLHGCVTLGRLDAVPPQLTEEAVPQSIAGSRYWPQLD
jgi:hypothetical protein